MFSTAATNSILLAKTKLISVTNNNNNNKVVMDKKSRKNHNNNNHNNKNNQLNGDVTRNIKSLESRREEVNAIRNRFPTKIPVVVKRFAKEVQLPPLDKTKYLVPQELTMSQFQTLIRTRMQMNQNQALYLLINNRSMLSLSLTLAEVYKEHAEADGFLYVTYASQEVFG